MHPYLNVWWFCLAASALRWMHYDYFHLHTFKLQYLCFKTQYQQSKKHSQGAENEIVVSRYIMNNLTKSYICWNRVKTNYRIKISPVFSLKKKIYIHVTVMIWTVHTCSPGSNDLLALATCDWLPSWRNPVVGSLCMTVANGTAHCKCMLE